MKNYAHSVVNCAGTSPKKKVLHKQYKTFTC